MVVMMGITIDCIIINVPTRPSVLHIDVLAHRAVSAQLERNTIGTSHISHHRQGSRLISKSLLERRKQ